MDTNEYRLLATSEAGEMTSAVMELVTQGWELYMGLVTDRSCLYQWMVKQPEDDEALEKILFPRRPQA